MGRRGDYQSLATPPRVPFLRSLPSPKPSEHGLGTHVAFQSQAQSLLTAPQSDPPFPPSIEQLKSCSDLETYSNLEGKGFQISPGRNVTSYLIKEIELINA